MEPIVWFVASVACCFGGFGFVFGRGFGFDEGRRYQHRIDGEHWDRRLHLAAQLRAQEMLAEAGYELVPVDEILSRNR